MRHLILTLGLLLPFITFAQQDNEYRVIPSLTDWIKEINNWPDTAYNVSKIKIRIDFEKDTLLIGPQWDEGHDPSQINTVINKSVLVDDFSIEGFFSGQSVAIKNIRFSKEVRFKNYQTRMISFNNVIFEKDILISDSDDYVYYNSIRCHYKDGLGFYDFAEASRIHLRDARVDGRLFFVRATGSTNFEINKGKFNEIAIGEEQFSRFRIDSAIINNIKIQGIGIQSSAHLVDNQIKEINLAGAQLPETNTFIKFDQLSRKIYSSTDYGRFKYVVSDSMDFELKYHYNLLIGSYKILQDRYQNIGDQESYNACYVEMKNIETQRLAYLFEKDPSFNSFFTWKINQFLKIFSAYGTEPSRAIIFSIYVIITFALVYLFFPNYWDSHGKHRIMDRYRFFTRYMKKDTGMHDVYLEDKQPELMASEDFKGYMQQSEKEIPKFFITTALPLYKWSVAGTKTFSWLLSKVDVLKGKWSDTENSKRGIKSVLLISSFLISLTYDIFIKMLNALMLSINTFTTLGFGEIPIKGLPRYLAIIQGFIGWFMLTIFSVSLISQLLN